MLKIIPTPKKITFPKNDCKRSLPCTVTAEDKFKKSVPILTECFKKIFEVEFELSGGGIEFVYNNSLKKDEYIITAKDTLRLEASDSEGLHYGIATIIQLVEVKNGKLFVPEVEINDYPDKSYRAIMVDLGRHWHPFDKLLKYIDICFLYKINFVHFHFVDEKLYTLPSKKFPKLNVQNKHYTINEIKMLNEYAHARGIEIVPEIEGPGHVQPLNKAYGEVFSNDNIGHEIQPLYADTCTEITSDSILCAGKKEAIDGIKAIIDEVIDMFPFSKYIHIGGDEVNVNVWENCKTCREYMKENNLRDTSELYCDYIAQIADYVLEKGRVPMVWEGFPKSGNHIIPRETVVVAWETRYQMPEDLLKDGFDIINSSWQPLYIVQHYRERWDPRDILKWNVYNWQHWWPESEAYLNPITVNPTDKVKGALMCAWCMTYEQEINFIIENLAAMSERVWSVRRTKTDEEYFENHLHVTGIAARLIQDISVNF